MPSDEDETSLNPGNDPGGPVPPRSPTPEEVFEGVLAMTPPEAGKPWQPLAPEELDALLPDYEAIELLGRGGMGGVYLAIQKSLGRKVAIKVLSPNLSNDLEFEVRFRREAGAMAHLNHPNIVQIYDFGQTAQGEFYLVMEYVDGPDLFRLIKSGKLDPDTALSYISQICDALQYSHDKGFVHRDIKPANIMLNSDGQIKVGDFGLAKLVNDGPDSDADWMGLTSSGVSMGTPHYMSPEQINGAREIDHRCDIYSLGVMFYEVLTGEIPRGSFPPPSKKVKAFDHHIDTIVLKAMASDPGDRYQHMSEVRRELSLLDSRRVSQSVRKSKAGKFGFALLWIGLIAIVLVAVGSMVSRSGQKVPLQLMSRQPMAATLEKPRIELPVALAEMKESGGILQRWRSSGAAEEFPPIDRAAGLTDLVSISVHHPRWVALRANRMVVTSDPPNKRTEALQNVVKARAHLGGIVLLDDGRVIEQLKVGRADHNMPEGVVDFESSSINAAFVLNTGEIVFRNWGGDDLEKLNRWTDQWEVAVNRIPNSVSLAVTEPGYGAVLGSDGEISRLVARGLDSAVVRGFGPEIKDLVEVANGSFTLVLRKDGRVFSVGNPASISVPESLPRAFAIRANRAVCAAQVEDGSWIAWGDNSLGVVDQINRLGPAVDLTFREGHVYWIKPAR
ncbi:MAG: serine/threonine-protein kinase [Verrucomicrobiales bacterium]|nr:serine/threonine-protein kinase [Verrucomicrobiales bacterium]